MKKKNKNQDSEFNAFLEGTTPISLEDIENKIEEENTESLYEETSKNVFFREETYVTAKEYAKTLIENLQAEKQWYDGTKFVLEELKNDGLDISMDEKDVQEVMVTAGNLFKIRYYRQLIHAAGLSNYEDRIMSHIIDKFFSTSRSGINIVPPAKRKV